MTGKKTVTMLTAVTLMMSACAAPAPAATTVAAAMTSTETADAAATTAAAKTTTTTTTTTEEQIYIEPSEEYLLSLETMPPEETVQESSYETADTPSEHKTRDVWYRTYRWVGSDDEYARPEDTILVEYNQKKNYVAMTMFFIGVNAFMSVDSADLVPIDGAYWIQDFMNADGSEPDLTRVYMKYSDSAITLYYKTTDDDFDWSSPSVFTFVEESD